MHVCNTQWWDVQINHHNTKQSSFLPYFSIHKLTHELSKRCTFCHTVSGSPEHPQPGTHHQKHMETQNKDHAKTRKFALSCVWRENSTNYKVINFYQNFHCVSKGKQRAEVAVIHLAFHIRVTPPSLKWLHGSQFHILGECDLYTLVNKVLEGVFQGIISYKPARESQWSHISSVLWIHRMKMLKC